MKTLSLLLGCAFALTVFAGSISDLTVTASESRIVVRWQSSDEGGLSRFVLQRSVDRSDFSDISTITPRGTQTAYQFIDTDLYNVDKTPRNFSYRLKFVNRDGTTSYSITRDVTIQISSIRRTWGSIKAMFR